MGAVINTDLPLVSCIVLSYKKFDYLPEAVRSVLTQDYPRIELLIADDGSPDFEPVKQHLQAQIAAERGSNLERAEIHHQPENVGTVKNINSMLRIASGSYYFLLSGDDTFWDTHVLSAVVDRFLQTGADLLSCSRMLCTKQMEPVQQLPTPEDLKRIEPLNTPEKQFRSFALLQFHNLASGSAMYYSKQHFLDFGLFDEDYRLWEDGPRLAKYTQAGHTVTTAYDIISVRYRGGGISNVAPSSSPARRQLEQDHMRFIESVLIPHKKELPFSARRKCMFWYYWDTVSSRFSRFLLFCKYPEYALRIALQKLSGKAIR